MRSNFIENLTIDQIRKEILDFKNDNISQKLDFYYNTKSYSEILGVSRKEINHSNFISWILNSEESHGLGYYPFIKFLEILVIASKQSQSQQNKMMFDSIIAGDILVNKININTEKNIANIGKIDIYIEADIEYSSEKHKLQVIIENKVKSKEHKDQTKKYYDYFQSDSKDDFKNLYVFLTPLSTIELNELAEPECSCKEYIQINYQHLVDYLFEPILIKDISQQTKNIILEYKKSLSQPTQDIKDNEYTKGLIMAIGKEERDLLTKFWDKNQNLILSALYAIGSDPEQDPDVRQKVTSALNSIKNSRDRSLYSIYYNNELIKEKFQKADIGYQTVILLDKKKLINDEIFEYLRNDKTASNKLIANKNDEKKPNKLKYRLSDPPELYYKNEGYYIVRNWGVSNVPSFIEKMQKKFTGLRYDEHKV